jgi:hypothetical protein
MAKTEKEKPKPPEGDKKPDPPPKAYVLEAETGKLNSKP